MKILVLSDSHSSRSFMRLCVDKLKPDTIVHLGDYYEDGEILREENTHIEFFSVPGNCDRYRCPEGTHETRVVSIGGMIFFMTHGHRHYVKQHLSLLLKDARQFHADAVLYGHTHVADCHWEDDGLLVMNPGSCGYYGGSAGLIEVENNAIKRCRIIRQENLEVFE